MKCFMILRDLHRVELNNHQTDCFRYCSGINEKEQKNLHENSEPAVNRANSFCALCIAVKFDKFQWLSFFRPESSGQRENIKFQCQCMVYGNNLCLFMSLWSNCVTFMEQKVFFFAELIPKKVCIGSNKSKILYRKCLYVNDFAQTSRSGIVHKYLIYLCSLLNTNLCQWTKAFVNR